MKSNDTYRKEQPFEAGVLGLQRIHYDALKNDEDDRVVIITGDTGAGKSNFAKWYFDFWYTKTLAEDKNSELLEYFCYGTKDWTKALKHIYDDELKYRLLYNDEAINLLYYRDSTTKGSKLIKKNFNIIRYLNTYHILTIPNCHELDPEIVRNRVNGMWYLSKFNGKRVASYFGQEDLLKIIQEIKDSIANKRYKRDETPRVTDTKAFQNRLFYVYPKLYTGWVDEAYMDSKHEQAGEAVGTLYEHYNKNESKNDRAMLVTADKIQKGAKIDKLIKEGSNYTRIAEDNLIGAKDRKTVKSYHNLYINNEETIS